jgi:hypothetical protein
MLSDAARTHHGIGGQGARKELPAEEIQRELCARLRRDWELADAMANQLALVGRALIGRALIGRAWQPVSGRP